MKSYFRPEVDALQGYVPGEQPKITDPVKLNTNENPYPPSPKVSELLNYLDLDILRRYSDPMADKLRDSIATRHGVTRDMVIVGNGSDDILTMLFRAFTDGEQSFCCTEPTYSLYPILASMQGAKVKKISLEEKTFAFPSDFVEQAKGANLLIIARPNAPTGNSFPLSEMVNICENFDGIVVIDEAYADFANDNCMELAKSYSNVVVTRTFSKSYSLAGARLGYAVAHSNIIAGLMKLKDSYNVNALTQLIGQCAFEDIEYFAETVSKVKSSRQKLSQLLVELGFEVTQSESNFLFVIPPNHDAPKLFDYLRENAIIVRYFSGEITGNYLRITIGTEKECEKLICVIKNYLDMTKF